VTISRRLLNFKFIDQKQGHTGFCVLHVTILLVPMAWIHEVVHKNGPRAVPSHEQSLAILLINS